MGQILAEEGHPNCTNQINQSSCTNTFNNCIFLALEKADPALF